ncbi:FADR060Cp [Eremothecium gossypii FDAG1]|nr:FADR060Cp [Eremothecium gossypii FDAG1]
MSFSGEHPGNANNEGPPPPPPPPPPPSHSSAPPSSQGGSARAAPLNGAFHSHQPHSQGYARAEGSNGYRQPYGRGGYRGSGGRYYGGYGYGHGGGGYGYGHGGGGNYGHGHHGYYGYQGEYRGHSGYQRFNSPAPVGTRYSGAAGTAARPPPPPEPEPEQPFELTDDPLFHLTELDRSTDDPRQLDEMRRIFKDSVQLDQKLEQQKLAMWRTELELSLLDTQSAKDALNVQLNQENLDALLMQG